MERTLLIGRVSGLIARHRPPRGALSAHVVSTAPAFDGHGRRESVCTGRRGGGRGWPSSGGGGWMLVHRCTVPGRTVPALNRVTQPTALCPHGEGHKIGYDDSNGGIAVEGPPNAEPRPSESVCLRRRLQWGSRWPGGGGGDDAGRAASHQRHATGRPARHSGIEDVDSGAGPEQSPVGHSSSEYIVKRLSAWIGAERYGQTWT